MLRKKLRRVAHRLGHWLIDIETGVTRDDQGHMYCRRCKRRVL